MANNVIANIVFTDDDWEIQKASLQHADGNLNLTAKVHQVNDASSPASAQIESAAYQCKKIILCV